MPICKKMPGKADKGFGVLQPSNSQLDHPLSSQTARRKQQKTRKDHVQKVMACFVGNEGKNTGVDPGMPTPDFVKPVAGSDGKAAMSKT